MGVSSSVEQQVPNEERVVENRAASMGSLPMLRDAFSKLADPLTNLIPLNSFERCLGLEYNGVIFECVDAGKDDLQHSSLLNCVGPSIVELFFKAENAGVNWVEFVKGYLRCCQMVPASISLNALFRVFAMASRKAGIPTNFDVHSTTDEENELDELIIDCKLCGSLETGDILKFFLMCWTLDWSFLNPTSIEPKQSLFLPDLYHLLASAVTLCVEETGGDNLLSLSNWKVSNLTAQMPVGKFHFWVSATLPSLSDCFGHFVDMRLRRCCSALGVGTTSQDKLSIMKYPYLLSLGRAWAVSLTLQDPVKSEVMKAFIANDGKEDEHNLLYRSSTHGRGLNRLWANLEGYHGPLLILVSAALEGDKENDRWILGARTEKGLENKDDFYGNSGILYAIYPIFHVFSPTGKEKNFIYSHFRSSKRAYEPHPKPVGLAFGGSISKERVYIDEDFARVTIRHHAVDKTYRPGSLFPSQGYLPVEALILEVEVWGLGGVRSKNEQNSYKKREDLFTEQRRKVDLKSFANWEDAPEKIMMDMMSDPNKVSREAR